MTNNLNILWFCAQFSLIVTSPDDTQSGSDEYCQSEYFQGRCLTNEVILMNIALYGRMRIGRCIKEKEVAALGPLVGEDPRYLGCSSDVIELLDRKCTLKRECDIRVIDISDENIQPCFPGLNVYLEARYSCISVVDERRSCVVTASKTPTHIIRSAAQQICGTVSQPWIIEAPIGQTIKVSLLQLHRPTSHGREASGKAIEECVSYGVVVDKAQKTNTSICLSGAKRENHLAQSTGNRVEILFCPSSPSGSAVDDREFILRFHAVGCSDIIPPDDAWLKRNADVIVIGCYSSRQTWHLGCKEGKWFGVLGNCTQGFSAHDFPVQPNEKSTIFGDEQVLALLAICGCTLAICLAIACIGAVCLRKKKLEYNTLNYQKDSARIQHSGQGILPVVPFEFSGNDVHGSAAGQPASTYSVYVAGTGFSEFDNSIGGTSQPSRK